MAGSWWKDPTADDSGISADEDGPRDAAARMFRKACEELCLDDREDIWCKVEEISPPHTIWHSVRNCVAHQAGVWQALLNSGVEDTVYPAAFKLALVLRHTPSDMIVNIVAKMLNNHNQLQQLSPYMLSLLTDDEAGCASCLQQPGENEPAPPAPTRDLQLFGDCELAVLAAPPDVYRHHARLVRAEYATLSQVNYIELRIRVLNQFSQIPKIYHTPEFAHLESAARDNISTELVTLRDELGTHHAK